MSDSTSLRRGVFLALSGATILTVLYLAHQKYQQTPTTPAKRNLHRSNAVRRSRRRWRTGYQPQHLDYNPTHRAIDHLHQRTQARDGYGWYLNTWVLNTFTSESDRLQFMLLPNNIPFICDTLLGSRTFTEYEQEQFRFHIHALFIQNFLRTEYPEGYLVGDDVGELASAMGDNIDRAVLEGVVSQFDAGGFPQEAHPEFDPLPRDSPDPVPAQHDVTADDLTVRGMREALGGHNDDNNDGHRRRSYGDQSDGDSASQNVLDLLYHIGEEQAKREGYIHRGVECNSCGVQPIQGIRYHCANCFDYDLCETCEAAQVHSRNHVFYKIRIPAPTRGNIKRVQAKWYPGNPNACPTSVPREVRDRLLHNTNLDRVDVDALYEQFKCLAGQPWLQDPSGIGMTIDRKSFDMYFTPTSADRPPPQNLIYDRIFSYYDRDNDGLISFEEFVAGTTDLNNNHSRYARLQRMFRGFDLDNDGYVDRRDFLRMLRAHYALTKELTQEMIYTRDDSALADEEIREVIHGSHPISAAFGGSIFSSHISRGGQDKVRVANGELAINSGANGVLQNDSDMSGDRIQAIGNVAVGHRPRGHPFRSFREEAPTDEPVMFLPSLNNLDGDYRHLDVANDEELVGPDPTLQVYGWPPLPPPETEDVETALGVEVPLDEIMDPVDRSRVFFAQTQRLDEESDIYHEGLRKSAVRERWQRKQFYTDEEEGLTKPPGYAEPDSSDEGIDEDETEDFPKIPVPSSRRQSLRSRSSSKVRFDDSAIDTDHESTSYMSSRSIPVNERWGGFELSEPEKDIGKEIIYQAVQQGFNEMLNQLFKAKEDQAVEAISTKGKRERWKSQLEEYERSVFKAAEDKEEALRRADLLRTEEMMAGALLVEGTPPDEDSDGAKSQQMPEPSRQLLELFAIGEPAPDPTLPQNRPDADSFGKVADESEPPPSELTLQTWIKHGAIDAEAMERGGYGKLDFYEFKRKMVADFDHLSRTFDGRGHEADEDDDDDDDDYWNSTADLGKLSFLSSWLEMAQF